MSLIDLNVVFVPTPDLIPTGLARRVRVFGVSVARDNAENSKIAIKDGGSGGDVLIEFELGAGTEPFLFLLPGGGSVVFENGPYVVFEGAANPNSISIIYQ